MYVYVCLCVYVPVCGICMLSMYVCPCVHVYLYVSMCLCVRARWVGTAGSAQGSCPPQCSGLTLASLVAGHCHTTSSIKALSPGLNQPQLGLCLGLR